MRRSVSKCDMYKSDYYGKVIKVVTELADVPEEKILGKSREVEVVDARWMLICLMRESGFSTNRIVELTGLNRRTIDNAINQFTERSKYSLNGIGNTMAIARQLLFK